MEQLEPMGIVGSPPATYAKRALPSRSARGKPRGPDLLAMPSAEYNRLAALMSGTDSAHVHSQTAGNASLVAAATRPAPVHTDAVQPDLAPAAAPALQPEARAQQKRAAVTRTERSRMRRQDGGSPMDRAERDAAAPPASIAEPRPEAGAGTAVASGAAGLVEDKRMVQGRQRKFPPSSKEQVQGSCAAATCPQQGQAIRGRARAFCSGAVMQDADAGAGTLQEQPVSAPARAVTGPPTLPGRGGRDQHTAGGNSSEDRPRANRKRKRRRDDKPAAKSTKRNRAPKACTEVYASLPVHHSVIVQPGTGPQLVDSVKLRRRSAPNRLEALDSRKYNLKHAKQRQEAAMAAGQPRQPEKAGQRRRSQPASQPQPAAGTARKQGGRKKLRKHQAHGREHEHEGEGAAVQRGAATAQTPLVVSQRCKARKAGTRPAATGANRHPVLRDAMLSQQAQPQVPMKRSKQWTRGGATPGSTQQWVHL